MMSRPLPIVVLSVLLSVVAAVAVATLMRPDATSAPAVPESVPEATVDSVSRQEHEELRRALDELRMELAALREQRAVETRERALATELAPNAEAAPLQAAARRTETAEPAPELRAQVADVLREIEEEREAAEWEEELEERREEAVEAYAEYDTFDEQLEPRLVGIRDELSLDGSQVGALRSLLVVQNERNREMTRLWSEGETSDEELEDIFMENRREHRREVRALLGKEQLDGYRQMIRKGHLGGRFGFFVGPRDDWSGDGAR